MKLLLTGARGFIGSYFVKAYKDIYTIHPFSFVYDDFEILHVKDINVVVHLSALVHQMNGASEDAYKKVNIDQTLALAKKAKKAGVRHFIFMSTVKVYGEENKVAYTEESLCFPEDAYGKTKLQAERALQELAEEDFIISIIRTPMVYGYGVKANMQSLMALVDKIPILPFGGITNKRSFAYVGNVCALIVSIIEQKKGGIFLAGDDTVLSTTELIRVIAKAKNKKVHLLHVKLFEILLKWIKPSFYQRLFESLTVNNKKTKEILHFQNPYSIEKGITLMVQGSER